VRSRRDPDWAAALLQRGWDPSIVPALPRDLRERAVLARVDEVIARPSHAATVVAALEAPWSPGFSVALTSRLRASTSGPAVVALSMPYLVTGLHPAALEALEQWLRSLGDGDRALATHLRNLLQLHSVKRSISEAFR
jgi:hypothetical protein